MPPILPALAPGRGDSKIGSLQVIVIIALIVDKTRQVKIGWVFGSSHTSLVCPAPRLDGE